VLEVVVAAEPEVVVLQLGRGVDPASLVAAERSLLVVAGDDVLPQLRADRLEQLAPVTDDREVPQQRVLLLQQVVRTDRHGRSDGSETQSQLPHPCSVPQPCSHARRPVRDLDSDGTASTAVGWKAPFFAAPLP